MSGYTPKMIVWTCRRLPCLSICTPKINFILHFFLEILHFKESCSFDWLTTFWPITWEPDFARYWIGVEVSMAILVFILDYFQEKLMKTFLKKMKKPISGPFPKIWAEMNFSWKKRSSDIFLIFQLSTIIPKLGKLLRTGIWHWRNFQFHLLAIFKTFFYWPNCANLV